MENKKLIVILGQTASGKTALSIKLAKKFGGEIISADSRQVYKGLDIGSGKVTKKEMAGVPHHLLSIANPKRKFTVAQYQKLAHAAITKIRTKGEIPFLVGGTGFYIQSIVDGIVIPEVPPNWKLRKQLETKSVARLFSMLKKLDPVRAQTIDPKNPRRLIRALEIVKTAGHPVPQVVKVWPPSATRALLAPAKLLLPGPTTSLQSQVCKDDVLQIGIKKSSEELKKLIQKRLQKRIKGIIAEVKRLHTRSLSFKRLEEFGLEYRYVAQYLQGGASHQEMLAKIQKESEHYAKRQMTWFKRDKNIHWVKNQKEAEKLIKKFL